MGSIEKHPILDIRPAETVTFSFNGKPVNGRKGFTIAAALHAAGYPVHSRSLKHRNRSLECGIGKCGACEMLVDGRIRRICITLCDGIQEVRELAKDDLLEPVDFGQRAKPTRIHRTTVAIIGAGPAGLACRRTLNEVGIPNLVIDVQDTIGGQFLMQTHQFFFFEKEKKYGGLRGFEIARHLAGEDLSGILLNSTVWDILAGNRLAVKNIRTDEISYVDAGFLVVASGAIPYMPPFENDDLPGVYTAAVVQKMMNTQFTLLGKNVLTVGAGNIGYLTSYQLMQAGARVKAIIEAMPREGGFPVQANRVRRLGVPIQTSTILVKAVPNSRLDGIVGAVVAQAENFRPIPGTEQRIDGIDMINICTGLVSDNQLLLKGREMFGHRCFGGGDSIRIGEGTSAVLRGKQVAYEIAELLGATYNYQDYLAVSKEYFDSQQSPIRVLDKPVPPPAHRAEKPYILIDCLYGFACNPCAFACPYGAITKSSTSTVPVLDPEKCTGCMTCVTLCPGLAIFGYNPVQKKVFLPIEFERKEGQAVYLVDNFGAVLGEGKVEKIIRKANRTHLARVDASDAAPEQFPNIRGFIPKDEYPEPLSVTPEEKQAPELTYICHCDDVTLDEILTLIGDRKFVSVTEIKHNTRLGMGACRGKRCFSRLKQILRPKGIEIVGEPTPRAPLANQVALGEVYPSAHRDSLVIGPEGTALKRTEVGSFVAGGGIGGSALFRYLAEAGMSPVMINYGTGASWRNIAGGRPVFSLPELSDIAAHNLALFEELNARGSIDFHRIHYVTFAHDEAMLKALEESMAWQDARMIGPRDFPKEISPYFNPKCDRYIGALKAKNCWQATPGKIVDALRRIGVDKGGRILEDCELIDVRKNGDAKGYVATVRRHDGTYEEFATDVFINALGPEARRVTRMMGIEIGLYPVKHQAFITRRLPMLGVDGGPLEMLIDRRKYRGFTAVYGQQLFETGQIIGCASPEIEPLETDKDLLSNSKEFLEIVSEVFTDWIPALSSVGFQAAWAGYYVEPRMIIDPAKGLFVGLRGQGFMLSQYLAKVYVDKLTGRPVPEYFHRLSLEGDGLPEKAFK